MNRLNRLAGWIRKTAAIAVSAVMIAALGPGQATAVFGAQVYPAAAPGSGTVLQQGVQVQEEAQELNGVWISYLEWEKLPVEKAAFQAAVNEMLDNCVNWGMNAVFVHAHSHTDAMYPSDILPWSKFVSGIQ